MPLPVRLLLFGSGPEIEPIGQLAANLGWVVERFGHPSAEGGSWGATEQNAELRILLQIQSPIKSRVNEFRYSSILERQELCRLSYSGFY